MMLDRSRFVADLKAGRQPRVTLTASDDLAVAVPTSPPPANLST